MFPLLPPSGTSEVIQVLIDWKERLLRMEAAQMREMAAVWQAMETRLDALFLALAEEVRRLNDAGETISAVQLIELERYRELLAQTREEMGRYADYAGDLIGERQAALSRLGLEQAAEVLKMSGVVRGSFNLLPVQAVGAMTGLTRDGTPLNRLLRRSWPDAVEGLTRQLIEAVALGRNPRETARAMRAGFEVGLNRALTIARTEQLRAYRESSRMQYAASGVVEGYRRLAAKQDRTCIACLVADGTFYRTEEAFEEHPNGRCTLVPVVRGMPALTWRNGRSWFLEQDEATQRRMMGRDAFGLWRDGVVDLDAFVKRHEDAEWGAYLRPANLTELGAR